jgi:hypothetical protein
MDRICEEMVVALLEVLSQNSPRVTEKYHEYLVIFGVPAEITTRQPPKALPLLGSDCFDLTLLIRVQFQ